jgi:hypothetical protein
LDGRHFPGARRDGVPTHPLCPVKAAAPKVRILSVESVYRDTLNMIRKSTGFYGKDRAQTKRWRRKEKSSGPKRVPRANHGMNSAWTEPTGSSLLMKVAMLVTLVAILCNGQLCLEKVVTTSEQSGITMTACQVNAQIGLADWLANGPYHEWKLQSYKCVMGKYTPKSQA